MKTCTKCGVVKGLGEFSKRSASKDGLGGCCKSCKAEKNKSWREANKERLAEYREANKERKAETGKAWREANKDRLEEIGKSWREANKERIAATGMSWYKANPEKVSARNRNRRARKRNSEGDHSAADIRAIFTNQRGLCAACQIKLFKSGKNKYHVDHIMPLALGGSNWPANLQCLCPSCNLRKSAKHPDDWAKLNGKLL